MPTTDICFIFLKEIYFILEIPWYRMIKNLPVIYNVVLVSGESEKEQIYVIYNRITLLYFSYLKSIFLVFIIEGLVGLHRTVQLLHHKWLGYRLGLL